MFIALSITCFSSPCVVPSFIFYLWSFYVEQIADFGLFLFCLPYVFCGINEKVDFLSGSMVEILHYFDYFSVSHF